AAGVCGGRGQLWDLNDVFLDNGVLKVNFCAWRSTFTMAANHTTLRVEPQGLFEDQLRDSDTRNVCRASGLVTCPSSVHNRREKLPVSGFRNHWVSARSVHTIRGRATL